MNVKSVQLNANIHWSDVNGMDRCMKLENTKHNVLIRKVWHLIDLPVNELTNFLNVILESGADVMGALKDREVRHEEEKKLFTCLVDLLSYEKITFNGECQECT